ncbi:hypothetical protein Ndes2526B_g06161 [Nannochloris sp. 'desiccata']|nr:putative UPF0696 protein C11orf68-like protein [Chlorella desiccata (nom. nud.)]
MTSQPADDELRFKAVEDTLAGDVSKQFNGHAYIQHIDISCDGCDIEPIVGKRFKCRVCEDRDLCENCMRALISARVKMTAELGTAMKAPPPDGSRPKHWISKLKSADERVKWGALLQAVPCLHPTHVFTRMDWGPERAVVLTLPPISTPLVAEKEETSPSLRSKLATQFLATFPPSRSSCTDVAWIIVDFPRTTSVSIDVTSELSSLHIATTTGTTPGATTSVLEKDIDAALEDWEKIISKRKPTKDDIGTIAKRHKILPGKWLLFPKTPEEADTAWASIVNAAALGKLTGCTQVKISPTNPNERGYVICAYTDDYLNEKEVTAAAEALRVALWGNSTFRDCRLLYKADVYTYLGIYSKNEWGLKPTIYSSTL